MKWVAFFVVSAAVNAVVYVQYQDVFNLVAAAAGAMLAVWVGRREFRG